MQWPLANPQEQGHRDQRWNRLGSGLGLALALFLICLAWLPARRLQACTVTGATLQHYTDSVATFYLNGTQISTCGACGNAWKTLTTHVFTAGELLLLNNAPGDNTLSTTIAESGGNVSGGTWKLNITYSDCPDQELTSNGFCTRTYYAGLYTLENYPAGWTTNGFNDSSWGGVFTSVAEIDNTWGTLTYNAGGTIPWIWGNTSFVATQNDVFAFRQKFQLGNPGYCPQPAPPSPTPCPASPCFPGTATPVPPPCTIPAISNGNAELAPAVFTTDATAFNNWYSIDAGNCQERWVTYTARSSTHSFNLSMTDNGGAGSCAAGIFFVQNLGCADTSCSYTVCSWVRTDWTSGTTGVFISVEQFDAAGTRIAGGPTVPRGDLYRGITATAWTQFCVSVGAGTPASWLPGMDHMRIVLGADTSLIQAYFDDITITQNCGITPTNTPTRTYTRTATRSATPTLTPSPTSTVTPSATPSATATPTFTQTLTPTNTPTLSNTPTATSTRTATVSSTATASATPTGTATPTSTQTLTPSATPTRTATPSPSFTFTATPSSTASPTRTASPTPSDTYTQTTTRTATPSRTDSPTPSPTYTQTVTRTSTATASSTSTATQTYTQTVTASATPSATETRTPTASSTVTETDTPGPSPTYTVTPTPTATESATPSVTVTASPTATPSDTYTQTVTRSTSPSSTESSTPTPTFTQTSSPSSTVTPSDTSTATPTSTDTSIASATPSPTETPSSTATPSSTVTPTDSPTSTDTPTATPTSTDSPVSSATATLTATESSTATPSSSLTPSVTPSSSATDTRSPTPTLTDSPTALPSITVSPTASPTFTVSPTLTPMPPLQVTMRIYSSAGELVYSLPGALALFKSPTGVGVEQPSFVPDDGQQADFLLLGADFTAHWNGTNDSGQTVSSGTYHVVFNIVDQFNQSTTYQQAVQVTRVVTETVIEVYNSAGELVWQQKKRGGTPGFIRIDDAEFLPDPAGGAGLKIAYGPAAADEVVWDGRSLSGSLVASGVYLVKVTREEQGKGKTVLTESVTVLAAPGGAQLEGISASPNPAGPRTNQVWVSLPNLPATGSARAFAYNLAGERLAALTPLGQTLVWDLQSGRMASGIYLIRVEADDGLGKRDARLLKVALLR